MNDTGKRGVSRRKFLKGVGAGVVSAGVAGAASPLIQPESAEAEPDQPAAGGHSMGPGPVPIQLTVNGKEYSAEMEPRTTLANALRYHLGLTGTKVVCDRGSCGACTVIMGGQTVYSCMTLAADARDKPIQTVEGLAANGRLNSLQEAFVQDDGLMCGFCTPGFVMSCSALLQRNPHPTADEVRDAVRGNLCRCGTYPRLVQACIDATGARRKSA